MYFGDLKGWTGQDTLWGFLERGALRIHTPTASETARIRALMEKYVDTQWTSRMPRSLQPLKRKGCIEFSLWTVIFGCTESTGPWRLKWSRSWSVSCHLYFSTYRNEPKVAWPHKRLTSDPFPNFNVAPGEYEAQLLGPSDDDKVDPVLEWF